MTTAFLRSPTSGIAILFVIAVASFMPIAAQSPDSTDNAAQAVADVTDAVPPTPSADLTEPNRLVQEGDYAAAEANLAEIQTEFPDDPRVIVMRGELLVALQRFDDAVPQLQRAVELKPDEARINFQLATALQATGQADGALAAYAKEIELNEDPQVQVMARMNRSMLLENAQDWSGAAAELAAVLELEPGRKQAYGHLANLFLQADRLDDASRALENGLMNGFQSARMYFNLGARYYNAQQNEAAIKAFEIALEIDPKLADAEKSLAGVLDRMGRLPEAAQHLRRYLELRPDARDAGTIQSRLREIERG